MVDSYRPDVVVRQSIDALKVAIELLPPHAVAECADDEVALRVLRSCQNDRTRVPWVSAEIPIDMVHLAFLDMRVSKAPVTAALARQQEINPSNRQFIGDREHSGGNRV